MRFEFSKWVLKNNKYHKQVNKGVPVPFLVMYGKIVRQTPKAYIIDVYGQPEPMDVCLRCGRVLTHPLSLLYGLGPECGKHHYKSSISKDNLEEALKYLRQSMAKEVWRGMIPKSAVTITPEKVHTIVFAYGGKPYRVTTSDQTKIKEMYEKADSIMSDEITER